MADSFGKREREKAVRERAARKRERRESRAGESSKEVGTEPQAQAELLAAIEALHVARERGEIDLEAFEAQRAELYARLL